MIHTYGWGQHSGALSGAEGDVTDDLSIYLQPMVRRCTYEGRNTMVHVCVCVQHTFFFFLLFCFGALEAPRLLA